MKACYPMTRFNKVTLYRSKLEGIYRAILDATRQGIKANRMVHWCDNSAGVSNTKNSPENLSAMMRPGAGLVLASKNAKRDLDGEFICKHVKGHHDNTKKARKKGKEDASKQPDSAIDSQSKSDSEDSTKACEEAAEIFCLCQKRQTDATESSQKGARST